MAGQKKKSSKGKGPSNKPKQPPTKGSAEAFLEQQQMLPPVERMAVVRPMWEALTPEDRDSVLTVSLQELREYAKIQAARARAAAEADAADAMAAGQVVLTFDQPLDEVLDTGLERSNHRGTWKIWSWPPEDKEFYDSDTFRKHLESNVLTPEHVTVLPRDPEGTKPVETKSETALRERMSALLTKVHEKRMAQEEAALTRRQVVVGRRQDPAIATRDATADLIAMMINALEQEHESLYNHCMLPVTAHICDTLPENARKTTPMEFHPDDLQSLLPDEVLRIYEFLTEKVDTLSSRLKPDPKDTEAEEDEDPIGDVDLFSLTEDGSALRVNTKWLGHLRSRVLGEDGQPCKAAEGEDPQVLGLALEWVYGTIVSTAEKARDAAHRSLGTRPPSVEAAVEALKEALEEQAKWEREARVSRELLANMLVSRKEAAKLEETYDMRPKIQEESGQTATTGAVVTGSSDAGDENSTDAKKEETVLPELPTDVIIFMLKRESLLTSAKLHYLKLDLLAANRKLRSYKSQLRQGEPQFERLKREMEEVKSAPARSVDGTFRSAAEMERHRAQAADAAIEEQIAVQTAFRETGAKLQKIYENKREMEMVINQREGELKQLSAWRRTIGGMVDSLEALVAAEAPLAAAAEVEKLDEEAGETTEEQRALLAAVRSATRHTEELQRLRTNFQNDIRRQLYTDVNDKAFFASVQGQLREIDARLEAGRAALHHLEAFAINVACDDPGIIIGGHLILPFLQERLDARALEWAAKKAEEAEDAILQMELEKIEQERQEKEKKAKAKAKAKEKARSEKERERREREERERKAQEAAEAEARKALEAEEEARRRRAEELEALRRTEEEVMERRRKELLADAGSHWRQRLEHDELLAVHAELEQQLLRDTSRASKVDAGPETSGFLDSEDHHVDGTAKIAEWVIKNGGPHAGRGRENTNGKERRSGYERPANGRRSRGQAARDKDGEVSDKRQQQLNKRSKTVVAEQRVEKQEEDEPRSSAMPVQGPAPATTHAPKNEKHEEQALEHENGGVTAGSIDVSVEHRCDSPLAPSSPERVDSGLVAPPPTPQRQHSLAQLARSNGQLLPNRTVAPVMLAVPPPPPPPSLPMATVPVHTGPHLGMVMPPPAMGIAMEVRPPLTGTAVLPLSHLPMLNVAPQGMMPPPPVGEASLNGSSAVAIDGEELNVTGAANVAPPPPPPPRVGPSQLGIPAYVPPGAHPGAILPPPPPHMLFYGPPILDGAGHLVGPPYGHMMPPMPGMLPAAMAADGPPRFKGPPRQLRVAAQPFVPSGVRSLATTAPGKQEEPNPEGSPRGILESTGGSSASVAAASFAEEAASVKSAGGSSKARISKAEGADSTGPENWDAHRGVGVQTTADAVGDSRQRGNRLPQSGADAPAPFEPGQQAIMLALVNGHKQATHDTGEDRKNEAPRDHKQEGRADEEGVGPSKHSTIHDLVDVGALRLVRGLENAPGLYNCFLNAVIQCLWHLSAFRTALLRARPRDIARGRPNAGADFRVFQALSNIFRKLHEPQSPKESGSPISVAELREALSSSTGGSTHARFDLSAMHDAAEVLAELFDRLHRAEMGNGDDPTLPRRARALAPTALSKSGVGEAFKTETSSVWGNAAALRKVKRAPPAAVSNRPSIVQRLFGIEVETPEGNEVPTEKNMNSTIKVLQFTKYFHLIPVQGLRWAMTQGASSFEAALVAAATGGGAMERLLTQPSVITLSLVWEAPQIPSSVLSSTFAALRPSIDISRIFLDVEEPSIYSLRAMVCYSSLHYFAFVLSEEAGQWLLLDDAHASVVGDWEGVGATIQARRLQPSLLFYEASAMECSRSTVEP